MERLKNIFVFIVLLLLTIPLLEWQINYAREKEFYQDAQLKGVFKDDTLPDMSIESWFSGSYQTTFDQALKFQIPFRPYFVRTSNQYAYHLFNKAKANGVKVGKKGYLYGQHYLDAYNSDDFIGDSLILDRAHKLEQIRNWLKAQGKELVFVQAPGKAYYYPEYLRKEWISHQEKNLNYLRYKQAFESYNIPYFDVQQWLLQFKDSMAHQVYPKTGIHWSVYAEHLVMDSLNRIIEQQLDTTLTRWDMVKVDTLKEPRDTDADIEDGMNLLYPIKKEHFLYPSIALKEKNQIPATVISDSFFWNIFANALAQNSLLPLDFLFYFDDYRSSEHMGSKPMDSYDLKAGIERSNVFVIICTDAKLSDTPWGFLEAMEEHYPSIFLDKQTQ